MGTLRNGGVTIVKCNSRKRTRSRGLHSGNGSIVVKVHTNGSTSGTGRSKFRMFSITRTAGRTSMMVVLVPSRRRTRICTTRVTPGLRTKGTVTFNRKFGVRFNAVAPTTSVSMFVITPGNPNRVIHHRFTGKSTMPTLFTICRSTANGTGSLTLT